MTRKEPVSCRLGIETDNLSLDYTAAYTYPIPGKKKTWVIPWHRGNSYLLVPFLPGAA